MTLTRGATLATSREPDVLIPASLTGLHDDATHLERQAAALEDAAAQVDRQAVPGWVGPASLGWDECRPQLAGSCTGVGGVYRAAAQALRAHADMVELARELVEVAIALWERGALAASMADGVCRPLGSGLPTAPWSGPASGPWSGSGSSAGSSGWIGSRGTWTSPLWQSVRASEGSASPFGTAGSAGSRGALGTSSASSVVVRPRGVPGLVPGPAVVPGADLCAEAERLLAELQAMVARSAAAVAAFLEECSAGLPDGLFHPENVIGGVWDWVYGIGEMWVRLNVIRSMADADGFGADVSALVNGATTTAVQISERPEDFARLVLDEQGWHDDPARWMGRMAPDLALTALGAPAAVAQARRLAALLRASGAAVEAAWARALAALERVGPQPRTFTSSDPYVGAAATAIDRRWPGSVTGVNSDVTMLNGLVREVDIEVGNIVVQVKSGPARGLTGQMLETIATTGRPVVAYAPDLPHGAWMNAIRQGLRVARTEEELIMILGELR